MRLFISLPLSVHIIDYIKTVQDAVASHNCFDMRHIPPENLHLTIKFIGKMSENSAKEIEHRLASVDYNSFKLCTNSLLFLPSYEKVRVIALSVESEPLFEFVNKIDQLLADIVKPESRAFKPHITIARVKKHVDQGSCKKNITQINLVKKCFLVKQFCLMQSQLHSEGVHYSVLKTFNLR